jgi:hypothetical protein
MFSQSSWLDPFLFDGTEEVPFSAMIGLESKQSKERCSLQRKGSSSSLRDCEEEEEELNTPTIRLIKPAGRIAN